jgi:hypothetical protein
MTRISKPQPTISWNRGYPYVRIKEGMIALYPLTIQQDRFYRKAASIDGEPASKTALGVDLIRQPFFRFDGIGPPEIDAYMGRIQSIEKANTLSNQVRTPTAEEWADLAGMLDDVDFQEAIIKSVVDHPDAAAEIIDLLHRLPPNRLMIDGGMMEVLNHEEPDAVFCIGRPSPEQIPNFWNPLLARRLNADVYNTLNTEQKCVGLRLLLEPVPRQQRFQQLLPLILQVATGSGGDVCRRAVFDTKGIAPQFQYCPPWVTAKDQFDPSSDYFYLAVRMIEAMYGLPLNQIRGLAYSDNGDLDLGENGSLIAQVINQWLKADRCQTELVDDAWRLMREINGWSSVLENHPKP